MSKEALVGLLVSIACLIGLALAPHQQTRPPILGDTYKLVFHDIAGIRVSDPVVIGGVEAGKVSAIDFAPKDQWQNEQPVVIVNVTVQTTLPLPARDTSYKVVSDLRGHRLINIIPGEPGPVVEKGGTLTAERPPEQDDQLQQTLRTFRMLSKQTEDLRRQFADADFRRETKDMASNLRFYSREFLASSAQAPQLLGNVTRELERSEAELRHKVERVDLQVALARDRLHRIGPSLKTQLAQYNNQVTTAQKQVDTLLAQAEDYNRRFDQYRREFDERVTNNLNIDDISRKAHEWAQKLDDYSALAGDIHSVTSDPSVQNSFKARISKKAALVNPKDEDGKEQFTPDEMKKRLEANLQYKSEQLKALVKKYQDMLDHFPIKP